MVKKVINVFLLFFISSPDLLSQKLPFRNYLEKNGLPSPVVNCISQDSKGYLWIGTDSGLSRFDGMEFKNLKKNDGLPDNNINTILEDHHGNIWIGSSKGVACYFYPGGFTNSSIPNSLADSSIYFIVEDEIGKLWFRTSKGLYCFDGKIFRPIRTKESLHTNKITAIAIGKKGEIWVGTDRGIGCFETNDFTVNSTYSTRDGLLDNVISALLVDSGGALWIGTRKGLNRFKEGKWISYTRKAGLIDDSVTAIMEDYNRNIWIGTWNGVSLFSREEFINYSTKNGLPNSLIYSISEDREGHIWFSTHSGASCLISLNIKTYTKEEGLPNETIFSMIQDKKGRYWFGTSEGLSCYHMGNFKNFTTKDGLISNNVIKIMEDSEGKIWIATPLGLSIFSSGSFTNYTKKNDLPNDILFDLVESRDGSVWIGSGSGLIRCINGKFSVPLFDSGQSSIFNIIEDTHGILWFSSRTGLYNYSGNRLTSISKEFNLPDNNINTIFEDSKGKIWVGSDSGLSCIDKGKFTHYSTKNSALLYNTCYCILEDQRGLLWIGHSKGISCFDGKEFRAYTSERMELTGRTWFRGITDNLGNLWFGTTAGVTTFAPPPVSFNNTPPPVYITGFKVMEKEMPLAGSKPFAYDQNIFRFNFAGISFTNPTGIQYKYRLENIDKDWQTTKDRSLFYPFLPPGSYTLKVKAINADGVESKKPAEYSFAIRPPFWQTWWFMFFAGLFLCGLLFLGLHWRVKRIREKAELKARGIELEARNRQLVISQRMELMGTLAAGTVHDLKNLLAVIIGYSRLMGQKYREDNEDRENIEIIKDTAATAVQMAKQILSFAREKNSSHEPVDLGMEITEILNTLKITQPKNIHILRNLQAEPILFPINPPRFQQLVMNLCLNAFQAMPVGGQLGISLSCTTDNEIILEISDSGAGISREKLAKIFDPFFTTKEQSQGTGLGLFVVKEIVTEYNGKIEVH
ncbi:MAG TPA: two-component regulator propeller domain-containing protein, partial [Candidatus Kapabacteria bacterium]|nr:two-component regulator propeller domain-containing protein [Candidatus Kapabacteria bacterium]